MAVDHILAGHLCLEQLGTGPWPQYMAEEKPVPIGKGHCHSHNMPAPAASLRQTLPGASQSKARLKQAGTDVLVCSFSLFSVFMCNLTFPALELFCEPQPAPLP